MNKIPIEGSCGGVGGILLSGCTGQGRSGGGGEGHTHTHTHTHRNMHGNVHANVAPTLYRPTP